MSVALTRHPSLRAALPWAVLGTAAVLVAANFLLHETLFHRGARAPAGNTSAEAESAAAATSDAPLPSTVSLPEGKFVAAGIVVENPTLVSLPAELGVPGRIEANLDRRVDVRPRAAGVVRDVKAVLGQTVKAGDVLAVLESPDVGTARLELRSRQRDLATARVDAKWKRQLAGNVEAMIPELRKRVDANVLEKAFADRPLGTFRATLGQAYSEFDIASHEEEKTAGLYRQQILGEHPAFVAKHTREGSQAKFEGVLEQTKFDADLQSLTAEQKVRQAESAVIDAAERLRILGVPEDVNALLARAADVAAASAEEAGRGVTEYPVRAPFDGTVLAKSAVPSQPAATTDALFTVADLSTVWVMVNIPESDFALLPALKHGKIRLTAAAYPDRSFDATLLSVGSAVDPATRTVPMTAVTPNADGLLKLGMFVRITLDTAVDRKALTVPTSAVVEVEGRKGVFVPAEGAGGKDAGGHAFTFRPVKLGRVTGDRQVIDSGLAAGAPVVTRGAFVLKSELILQNETDEE